MISVIIPVYNAVEYLPQCVESILRQVLTDIEIILVEDGSIDGSASLCRDYALRYPEKIKHIANAGSGVSEARNTGIANATGEYIVFADADDCYLPGAFEYLLEIMNRTDDCDIVVGQYTRNEKSIGTQSVSDNVRVLTANDAIVDTLYQRIGCHPSAWAKLYHRSIFDGGNNFIAGRRYEDLEASVRFYLKARKIAFFYGNVYYYRPNSHSFINTWSRSRADALWATDTIENFVASNCPCALLAAKARRFSAYYNIFNHASAQGEIELVNKCWEYIKTHRCDMLVDSNVRLKNRIGALTAFLGKRIAGLLGRLVV